MKTLIFILLLMPVIGLAQSNTVAFHLFNEENFNLKQEIIQAEARILPNALVSSTPNFTDENKTLLDSSYQVNFNSNSDTSSFIREYYKYDEKGNRILLTNINPCEGCAASSHKIETTFNENGDRNQELFYVWDFIAKQWIRVRKTVYTFDGKGRLTNIMEHMWLENGTEVNPVKTNLSYDDNNNVSLKVSTRYDANTNEWVGNVKDEYTYNNDKCILLIFYQWSKETSQWVYLYKSETEYDVIGNITLEINYNWENSKNQWIPFSKRSRMYSQEGKMTHYTNFQWDISTSQWINNQKTDYSYDTNGRETEEIYSEWDISAGKWIGLKKYESSYNEKAFLTSTTISSWNKTINDWDIGGKVDYEYDQQGNNTMKTNYHWNPTKNEWWIREKSNYYYSLHDLTSTVDFKENQQVKLYPNPVHEVFTIEINDPSATHCQIFNSSGQLLQTLLVQMGVNTFNISHLRQGMYLLKIKTMEGMVVKKIIKN